MATMQETAEVGTDDGAAASAVAGAEPRLKRKPLAAFIFTLAVVLVVLVMLPATVESMVVELRGQATDHVYDLFTGQAIDPAKTVGPEAAFANVTVTNLDEASRMATLTVYGNRVCDAACPEVTATFYSIGNESARRRGLPPSASITIPGGTGSYTYTIELPIKGTPQRYPFDDYTLLLGLVASVTLPDGTQRLIDSPELMDRTVSLTLEDLVVRLNMIPPQPIDPAAVRSPSDPADFLLVDMLQWQRPRYLRILSVLMVILISASGVFALGLHTLPELVLGIGGIILGIWGVRSVVVQSPLPDVTMIDLILGFVMLVLLLILAIRAAKYFYVQSGLAGRWRRG
jgi:hypothetical protein